MQIYNTKSHSVEKGNFEQLEKTVGRINFIRDRDIEDNEREIQLGQEGARQLTGQPYYR